AEARHVEPEEKSAVRTPISVPLADDLVSKIVFLRIESSIFFDMRFIAICGDRDALRRHWHLRRRDVAQFQKAREELSIAGSEADAQARQVGALGTRLELDDVRKIGSGCLEDAGRRLTGIDLGITFVAEQEKTNPSGEGDNAPEIGKVGDRALRIRRRGNEERDGAREEVFRERFEIGKKA